MSTVKTFLIGFFGTLALIMFSTLWVEVRKNLELEDRIQALCVDIKHLKSDLKSEKMLVELCEQELAKYEKPPIAAPSTAIMTWLFGPPELVIERKCINVR